MTNRLTALLAIALALAAGFAAAPAFGQEQAASSYSQPSPEAMPFTLIVVGTRHYSDVDVMRRNIARIPMMRKFVQTVSSQKHVQFSGSFSGTEEGLVEDIRGLAAERFDVGTRKDKSLGLVITLRKIGAGQE